MHVQWNLSSLGQAESVCTQTWYLFGGQQKLSCLSRCSHHCREKGSTVCVITDAVRTYYCPIQCRVVFYLAVVIVGDKTDPHPHVEKLYPLFTVRYTPFTPSLTQWRVHVHVPLTVYMHGSPVTPLSHRNSLISTFRVRLAFQSS